MPKGIKAHLKDIKAHLKKFKNKIPCLSRPPSPNHPTAGTQAPSPSNLTLAPLVGPTGGIAALAAQEPSSHPRSTIPQQPEPENTVIPNTKLSASPTDSGSALAIMTVPTKSVQPASDVYADQISPSVRDKANPASIGFQGFKTVLTVVDGAAGIFPPLKSVTGGLLGLIDIVEVREFDHHIVISNVRPYLQMTCENKEDRAKLEQRIGAIVSILESHQPSSLSSRRLEGLAMFVSVY
jgi:hypothetical protein